MKRAFLSGCAVLFVFAAAAAPARAQYNDCHCRADNSCEDPVPGMGKDCSTGTALGCGTRGCTIAYQPVMQLCGDSPCGYLCTYSASCRGPDDCTCLANGNCSDPKSGAGMDCSTEDIKTCGTSPCSSSYRPIQQVCKDATRRQDCGYKCVYDAVCAIGQCQSTSHPFPTPNIGCSTNPGDWLCGSGGCNACSRFIIETVCDGAQKFHLN